VHRVTKQLPVRRQQLAAVTCPTRTGLIVRRSQHGGFIKCTSACTTARNSRSVLLRSSRSVNACFSRSKHRPKYFGDISMKMQHADDYDCIGTYRAFSLISLSSGAKIFIRTAHSSTLVANRTIATSKSYINVWSRGQTTHDLLFRTQNRHLTMVMLYMQLYAYRIKTSGQ
jgi:hypothetical protein